MARWSVTPGPPPRRVVKYGRGSRDPFRFAYHRCVGGEPESLFAKLELVGTPTGSQRGHSDGHFCGVAPLLCVTAAIRGQRESWSSCSSEQSFARYHGISLRMLMAYVFSMRARAPALPRRLRLCVEGKASIQHRRARLRQRELRVAERQSTDVVSCYSHY